MDREQAQRLREKGSLAGIPHEFGKNRKRRWKKAT
jgi:hypothetical protein